MASRGEIYSTRSDSEKRTYFFNVKENRRGDVFLNIVESSKKEDGENFDRHQIMVYEEDLRAFMEGLNKAASIAMKKDDIRRQAAAPKKFKKVNHAPRNAAVPKQKSGSKTGPKTGSKTGPKTGSNENRSSATNLQRKKVSLKLKKKRSDDET